MVLEALLVLLMFVSKPDPPWDLYDVLICLSQVPGIFLPVMAKNGFWVIGMFVVQVFVYYKILLKLIQLRERPGY